MSSSAGVAHTMQMEGKPGNSFTSINIAIPTSVTIWERIWVVFFSNIYEIFFPLRENRKAAGEPDQIFWL